MKSEWVTKLEADTCGCTPCSMCSGGGMLYFDFSGRFIGTRRWDDCCDEEYCDECGGSGKGETCERCFQLRDWDDEEEMALSALGTTTAALRTDNEAP